MDKGQYKSKEELYFMYYLDQLKAHEYVKKWGYEVSTFDLTDPYKREYTKQLKTKTKVVEEHLIAKSSITADFTIHWTPKAINVFYLDSEIPVESASKIPFRTENARSRKIKIKRN